MQLEVGKRYVTRHGQVSGVLQARSFDPVYAFWDPDEFRSYRADGSYFDNCEDDRDLVAGYVEPVAALVEEVVSDRALQLEAGKRYVRRDGIVTGPMGSSHLATKDNYPFWDPSDMRSYSPEGLYVEGSQTFFDLIKEYLEPDVPAAVPVEDKFSYADMVRALKKSPATILDELGEDDVDLIHMGIGVAGEAGELLDAVKRRAIYRKPLDRENVIEELGDLEFYMEGIRQTLQITREETLEANKRKLGERYKSKVYSDQAAQERADKVVPHEA